MTITPNDIYNLIHQGENTSVEMKKCSDSVPRSVWETYSAFANTRGGVILSASPNIRIALLNHDLRLPESRILIKSRLTSSICLTTVRKLAETSYSTAISGRLRLKGRQWFIYPSRKPIITRSQFTSTMTLLMVHIDAATKETGDSIARNWQWCYVTVPMTLTARF